MISRPGTIKSVLAEILTNQLHYIEYNYNALFETSNSERLHDLRVAIRRTRFALRLFASFQDILGKHQDALTVIKKVKEVSKGIC